MPTLSRRRRIATAARWPVGLGLTSWSYLWRTTPLSRREFGGDLAEHRAPEFPAGFDTDGIQRPREGAGPMFHRVYRVRIAAADVSAVDLIHTMRRDPDVFVPSEFASFEKVEGEDPFCRAGTEYVVRMPGPWDGPVRTVAVTETKIRLATLEGHLEAGQIEFRAEDDDGLVIFTIESWARSADRLTDILYDHTRVSKEIQLHMWLSFLERVVERSGGRRTGCVEVVTRRIDEPQDD